MLDRSNYARTIKSDRSNGPQALQAGEERVVRYGRAQAGDAAAEQCEDLSAAAPDDPQSVRGQRLSIYGLMVGSLELSRTLVDGHLADIVLEQGFQSASTLPDPAGHR